MVTVMKGNGKMIEKKVTESSTGKTAIVMKGNGKMVKKKVMESSIGRPGTVMMAIIMKGSLRMV